ncbi:MAG: S46 family peptidase, partial [Myxococcales bacterium]|nr:S46 family peptidase [Myxococcales bacterium]
MNGRPFALGLALIAACSPASTNGRLPDVDLPKDPTASASASNTPPAGKFENPGGMWLPEQLALQKDTFKSAGFTIEAQALTKPTEFPLGAVVSLGGCSASFVSPDGLIVTNHHCVTGALQFASDPKDPTKNYMKLGFVAKTRAEEKSGGPALRVFVTRSLTDVTSKMRDGLTNIADDLARYQALEDRSKELVAACEKGKEGIRCSVVPFFGGAEYRLIEQLEIRDVRIVYAPPESVGNFGGEIDNWRWPRHGGDFSFYRAYVDPSGKPADFNEKNVPMRPPHVLKLAKTPLRAGDPVMVAGYPGRTNRLTTAAEVREAVASDIPYTIDFCATYLAELERLAKTDKELAIKAETNIRGLSNALTNYKGQLEGLTKGGLADKKAAAEKELLAWIGASAERARYSGAVEKTSQVFLDSRKAIDQDRTLREALRLVRLFATAHSILRNAEEREKPDEKRDPEYQDRNQKRLEQSMVQLSKSYSPVLDAAMLKLVLKRELALPADKRAGLAEAILGKGKPTTDADIDKAIKALYAGTKLGTEATRVSMMTKASLKSLETSTDPLIKLVRAVRKDTKALEERGKRADGAFSLVRPTFVTAMREQKHGLLAPDANSTLRITYGSVRGYAPSPGAPVYTPFTLLPEVVKKTTGVEPFDAPPALASLVKDKKF